MSVFFSTLFSLEKKLPNLSIRHFCDHVYTENAFLLHQTSQLSRSTTETDIILLCSQVQHPIRWPQALIIRNKTRNLVRTLQQVVKFTRKRSRDASSVGFRVSEYLRFCSKKEPIQYKIQAWCTIFPFPPNDLMEQG